jgi:hypothetical protein
VCVHIIGSPVFGLGGTGMEEDASRMTADVLPSQGKLPRIGISQAVRANRDAEYGSV